MTLDASPRTIGKYQLIGALGSGGMADVYLAVAQGLAQFEKLLVIKRLRPGLANEESFVRMFLDEARLAARLHHPNIVQTYEVGELGGEYFIAMEYLDGQPLRRIQRAAVDKKLPHAIAVHVAGEILAGLDYAHKATDLDGRPLNVVHRDVSPQNVFVTYRGEVKLIDFGIAKDDSRPAATEAGIVKGKVAYMAPEQALGAVLDRRADVFAVGVILHELLCARKLFVGDTPKDVMQRLLDTPIPRVRQKAPDVDEELDAIVARALEKNPSDRYASAGAMRAELRAWLEKNGKGRALGEELSDWVEAEFKGEHDEMVGRVQKRIAELRRDPSSGSAPLSSLTPPPSIRDRSSQVTRAEPAPTPSHPSLWPLALGVSGAVLLIALIAIYAAALRGKDSATTATSASVAAPPQPGAPVVLRMCGSDTIGGQLAPALVEAFFAKNGASDPKRSAPNEHTWRVEAGTGDNARAIEIDHRGSATAFTGLADGACDLGMSSRRVKDEELKKLEEKGLTNMRRPASEHVIGLDGVAIIVNANSPLTSIQRSQLHDVFTGKITDWSALSAGSGAITTYARDDKSGTWDTFKELVLAGDALAPSAKRFAESDRLADAVASDPLAIGFVGLPSVRSAKVLGVGDTGAVEIIPSRFTIAAEDYPLTRRLYLYSPPSPKREATNLVSFIMSADGQAIVARQGFVDLAVSVRPPAPCDKSCPPEYVNITRGAKRLSVDFRFEPGSTELDGRAQLDIERVTSFLSGRPDAKLMLLGFSDSTGTGFGNVAISQTRAHAVEVELIKRGVRPARVEGFGDAMPVASNSTQQGRDRNRRVEAWILE